MKNVVTIAEAVLGVLLALFVFWVVWVFIGIGSVVVLKFLFG